MIIYCTQKMRDRYKIPTRDKIKTDIVREITEKVVEKEAGKRIYEWAAHIFYLQGRKCIIFMNFETKLVVLVPDIKVDEIDMGVNMIAENLFNIYAGDKAMEKAITKYLMSSSAAVFDKLTDKSAIASINRALIDFGGGECLYDYIEDNIMHSMRANKDYNTKYPVAIKADGEKNYYYPAEYFREKLLEYFG